MAFEELNTAESRKKHLGIIEDVLAVNSYSTPLVTSSDAVTLQGRSFTVAAGNTTMNLTTLKLKKRYILLMKKNIGVVS